MFSIDSIVATRRGPLITNFRGLKPTAKVIGPLRGQPDAACDAYETSFGQQDSAKGSRIAKNAEINDKMNQMIALKSTITHMVPNFCSANPGASASWNSAAHVEAPPKKKVPPTP